jgi:hypothetical protein
MKNSGYFQGICSMLSAVNSVLKGLSAYFRLEPPLFNLGRSDYRVAGGGRGGYRFRWKVASRAFTGAG